MIELHGVFDGVGLPAGEGRQHGGGHVCILRIQLFLHGLEDIRHFGDAYGLEQVIVYAVAADDNNMNVGQQRPGGLGQLDAVHAVHADIRDEQLHAVLLQVFQSLLPAGGGAGDRKSLGKLLDDAAHKA